MNDMKAEYLADAALSGESPNTRYLLGGCTESECKLCRTPGELRTPGDRHSGLSSYPHFEGYE